VLSGGEPLLRDDIFELARYGVQAGLRVSMGTNATLIDDSVASRLRECGIGSVAVSLDSSTHEFHDLLRGVDGSWESAIKGISACVRANIPIQINTTVSDGNCRDVDRIIDLSEKLGAKDVHLFFLVSTGRGKMVNPISPRDYEASILRTLKGNKERKLQVKPTCAPQFKRIAAQEGIDTSRWSRGCVAGISYCRIYPDGEVTPCPYLPVGLGNVRQTLFKTIWTESDILAAMRDPMRLKGRCGRCEYRGICGGCRARAYSSDNYQVIRMSECPESLLMEDPFCTYEPGGDHNLS